MPVENKVKASTAAAAVSGIVLWIIGRYAFKNGAVPDVVASWVYVLVPAAVTFAAGYLAKHTNRPAVPVPAAGRPLPPGYPESVPPLTGGPPVIVTPPAEKTLAPPAADGPVA
jgi:hypothetical protein